MKRSILLLDDEEPILFALSDYFGADGWDVWAAREVEEAEAILAVRTFSAAILDLRLTGFGGTEGLQILHLIQSRTPRTRVVLLTAFGTPQVEERARKLGVDWILHKPQPLPLIADIVSGLIEAVTPASADPRLSFSPRIDPAGAGIVTACGELHVEKDSSGR